MLRKLPEIQIDQDDPFKYDRLERRPVANSLTNLLKTLKQPFVFSISAPWGMGKTTFIRMWEASLRKDGFTCLYFNAWENDFSNDPFISFVGEIEQHIQQGLVIPDNKKKSSDYLKRMKKVGGNLLKTASPLAIKLATYGIINNVDELKELLGSGVEKTISDYMSKIAESEIKEYNLKKKSIKSFKEDLESFSKLISKEQKYPVVFFIDELDRCRPTYAIELLESIKHLFSVDGIVFILAIDRNQIVQSIKSQYGLGMEADGYLRKFIDLDYYLPKPSLKKFCKSLVDDFDIENIPIIKGDPQAEEYLSKTFMKVSEMFDLSYRVQTQCFTQINLVLRITPANERTDVIHLAFLVALRAKEFSLYNSFNERKMTSEELINSLKQKYNWAILFEREHSVGRIITCALERAYLDFYEHKALIQKYRQKSQDENLNSEEKEKFLHMERLLTDYFGFDIHSYLVQKIEITKQFNL